jgi:starch phosphorylase
MKAAINGTLNCSVLDGWWDEMFDGDNGWAIGTRDTYLDHEYQDAVESSALYDLLERDIAPRFYDRSEGQIPRRWIERVKESMITLGPSITADRMVRDYVDMYYVPAAERGRQMAAGDYERAKALAAWKKRVREGWEDIQIVDVEGDVRAAEVEEKRSVRATVRVGRLDPDDISVQLAHGLVGANNELMDPTVDEMKADVCSDGTCTYRGEFSCEGAGLYGFAVRVVPEHEDLADQMNMGLVTWA